MSPDRVQTRNAVAVLLPELLWGAASAMTIEGAMPAAFSEHLGAGEGFLGTWTLVGSMGSGVAMLFTAWAVSSLRTKRGFVFWGHVITGALYLPVALLARAAEPLGPQATQAAALVGFLAFVLSLGLLMPAWLALVGALFPEGQRSRVLGLVFVANRMGGIAGGLCVERLLALPWHGRDLWLLLWGLAAGLAVLAALPFLWIVERPQDRPPRVPLRQHFGSLLHALRDLPDLRRFVRADLLMVTGIVVLAFYGHVALRDRGVPESYAGRFTAVTGTAQLVGAALVAWGGTRLRPRRGLAVGALAASAAAVLTCLAQGPAGFSAVAALGGLFIVARQTCHGPQVLRMVRGHEPTHPLALAMAIAALAQGVLPLAVGLAAPVTGFPPLLLGVAASTLLAALWLAFRVGDAPSAGVR